MHWLAILLNHETARMSRWYYSLFLIMFCVIWNNYIVSGRITNSMFYKVAPAHRVCLPGPNINRTGNSTNHRKCLILGDSISIGYTSDAKKALKEICTVYHSPWDVEDGGALDTKHGLDCLQLLTSSSNLNPVFYDAVVFNFGLHDIDCDRIQDEFTSLENYSKNLKKLKEFFLKTDTRLAYALTTPILDDCDANQLVIKYNNAASDVMRKYPKVKVIDLYDVIIKKCGGPPNTNSRAPDCPITSDTLIPHYTAHGYKLLADPVVKTFRRLLAPITAETDDEEIKVSGDDMSGNDLSPNESNTSEMPKKVNCKSKDNHTVSACPPNSTCVPNKVSGSKFACCLLPDAMYCKDGVHCCPKGSECSADCKRKRCSCLHVLKRN